MLTRARFGQSSLHDASSPHCISARRRSRTTSRYSACASWLRNERPISRSAACVDASAVKGKGMCVLGISVCIGLRFGAHVGLVGVWSMAVATGDAGNDVESQGHIPGRTHFFKIFLLARVTGVPWLTSLTSAILRTCLKLVLLVCVIWVFFWSLCPVVVAVGISVACPGFCCLGLSFLSIHCIAVPFIVLLLCVVPVGSLIIAC